MTNAEARFNNSLRPRKPEGSLGRTAQDVHLDFHTAPELSKYCFCLDLSFYLGYSPEAMLPKQRTVGLTSVYATFHSVSV